MKYFVYIHVSNYRNLVEVEAKNYEEAEKIARETFKREDTECLFDDIY